MKSKFRDFCIVIYEQEVTENLINDAILKFKDFTLINSFIHEYKRYKQTNSNVCIIKGCNACVRKCWKTKASLKNRFCDIVGLGVRNQDFPFLKNELKDKDILIVGLEVGPAV